MPPTDRQKEYARELGIELPEDIDRVSLSALIDAAVAKRDDERYQRLMELDDKQSKAYRKIEAEILQAISRDQSLPLSMATPGAITSALADRRIGAILVTFPLDKLDSLVNGKGGVEISYCNRTMTEQAMRKIVGTLGVEVNEELKRSFQEVVGVVADMSKEWIRLCLVNRLPMNEELERAIEEMERLARGLTR